MRRAGTVAVLVLALAGCTPQPAPSAARSEVPVESSEPRADEPDASQIVGGYGELHVAPDGAMLFCASDDDPGFTGSWRDCADGIRTAGVDTAAIDASLGSAPADPGGHRWSGAAAGRRSLEDGRSSTRCSSPARAPTTPSPSRRWAPRSTGSRPSTRSCAREYREGSSSGSCLRTERPCGTS